MLNSKKPKYKIKFDYFGAGFIIFVHAKIKGCFEVALLRACSNTLKKPFFKIGFLQKKTLKMPLPDFACKGLTTFLPVPTSYFLLDNMKRYTNLKVV